MSDSDSTLTLERLKSELHYDPDTGIFTNLIDRNSRSKKGKVVGCLIKVNDRKVYLTVGFDGKNYYLHRLAIYYVTGSWPELQVDHIDGDPTNNRYANLRETSNAENQHNRKRAQRTSSTGLMGVFRRNHEKNPFFSMIRVDGVRHYLGCFPTATDAFAAYLEAKRRLHAGNML